VASIQNIKIIKQIYLRNIKVHKRIDYNKLNNAIFMQIRLVIIAQLSAEVVGSNVEIWWGAGCFNISCLVLGSQLLLGIIKPSQVCLL
jgi:hypothetical protein